MDGDRGQSGRTQDVLRDIGTGEHGGARAPTRRLVVRRALGERRELVSALALSTQGALLSTPQPKPDWGTTGETVAAVPPACDAWRAVAELHDASGCPGEEDGRAGAHGPSPHAAGDTHSDGTDGMADELEELLQQAQALYDSSLERARADLVELAMLLARSVVEAQAEDARPALEALVTSVLGTVREARQVMLHVHPAQVGRLAEWRRRVEAERRGLFVGLEGLEGLGPADVVANTPQGRVDARLTTLVRGWRRQLQRLRPRESVRAGQRYVCDASGARPDCLEAQEGQDGHP